MTLRLPKGQCVAAVMAVSGIAAGGLATGAAASRESEVLGLERGTARLVRVAESQDSWWCKIMGCGRSDVPGGVEARPDPEGSGATRGLSGDGDMKNEAPAASAPAAEPAPPPATDTKPE